MSVMSTLPFSARISIGGLGGGGGGCLETLLGNADLLHADLLHGLDMEFYKEDGDKIPDTTGSAINKNSVLLSVCTHKEEENSFFDEFISLVDTRPEIKGTGSSLLTFSPNPSYSLNSSVIHQSEDRVPIQGISDQSHSRTGHVLPATVTSMPSSAVSSRYIEISLPMQDRVKTNQKKLFYSSLGFSGVPGLSRAGERRSSLSPLGGRSSTSPQGGRSSTSPRLGLSPPGVSPPDRRGSSSWQGWSSSPRSKMNNSFPWRSSLSPPGVQSFSSPSSSSFSSTGSAFLEGSSAAAWLGINEPGPMVTNTSTVTSNALQSYPAPRTTVVNRPAGNFHSGSNSLGSNSLGNNPVGSHSVGSHPVGRNPVGRNPVGRNPVGRNPVVWNAVGRTDESLLRRQLQAPAPVPPKVQETVLCQECGNTLAAKCIMKTCLKSDEVLCQRCNMELSTKCILNTCLDFST